MVKMYMTMRPRRSKKRDLIGLAVRSNRTLEPRELTSQQPVPFARNFMNSKTKKWLGLRDSNPRMMGPEPIALPLGETPIGYFWLCRLGFNYMMFSCPYSSQQ